MEIISRKVNFDFLGKRKLTTIFSTILLVAGLLSLIINGGPKFGIEFKGGNMVEVGFSNTVDVGDIRTSLNAIGLGTSEIKGFGSNYLITADAQHDITTLTANIKSALEQSFPSNTVTIERTGFVGPKVGREFVTNAIFSIGLALFFLVIYISWRFEFKFALGAVAALAHDVLIVVGVFSILNMEVTLAIVAALLTIVGYSLNDTIVVSDRIRENIKVLRRENFHEIINKSLNQTLTRTIITSLTTLLVVMILFVWGGAIIRDLAFALIVGVTIGTYSSIFVASPIVVVYHDWQEGKKIAKKRK